MDGWMDGKEGIIKLGNNRRGCRMGEKRIDGFLLSHVLLHSVFFLGLSSRTDRPVWPPHLWDLIVME